MSFHVRLYQPFFVNRKRSNPRKKMNRKRRNCAWRNSQPRARARGRARIVLVTIIILIIKVRFILVLIELILEFSARFRLNYSRTCSNSCLLRFVKIMILNYSCLICWGLLDYDFELLLFDLLCFYLIKFLFNLLKCDRILYHVRWFVDSWIMLLLMSPCGVACEFNFVLVSLSWSWKKKNNSPFFQNGFILCFFFFLVAGFAPTHTHTDLW